MRPGVTDQLAGIRRILDETIGPELRPGYPSQMLRGVVKNLAMLEQAWPRVLPFLVWDADATAALLREATPYLDGDLAERVSDAVTGQPDPLSFDAVDAHHAELRALLADAIPQLTQRDDAAAVTARIKDHLVERMGRYPFRMALAAPTRDKDKKNDD